MLSLSPRVRIFAAVKPVDFRKGFDRLVQVERAEFGEDPSPVMSSASSTVAATA